MAERTPRAAIVTGASSGIGRATALELARDGWDIGMTYSSDATAADDIATQIADLGRRVEVRRLDLADHGAVPDTVEGLLGAFQDAHVLVNNAAVNHRARFLDLGLAEARRIVDINLIGPWLCARTVARHLATRARGGRVINITSVLAHAPVSGGSAYCVAKGGLDALTRVMALELAPLGITVNSVAPGKTATPMNYAEGPVDVQAIPESRIPLGRPADPTEIARAIAFIASDEARYMTGAALVVDGGLLLHSGPQALEREAPPPTLAERSLAPHLAVSLAQQGTVSDLASSRSQ